MISSNRFYEFFHELFCYPNNLNSYGFIPSYTTKAQNISDLTFDGRFNFNIDNCGKVFWWCEEPFNEVDFDNMHYFALHSNMHPWTNEMHGLGTSSMVPRIRDIAVLTNICIVANSEKSKLKNLLMKKYQYYDWYFFYHGFIALDWFRDYKYLKSTDIKISKLFICLNHLLTENRSYRLTLLSKLFQHNIINKGIVSAPLLDQTLVKTEVFNPNTKLSKSSKLNIMKNLYPVAKPLILDHSNLTTASASIVNNLYSLGSLWNIVTETIFYQDKLHLTEKIFKPIVLRRPFILIGAPGNLQYLKEYGFKTFDKWIDESYDSEQDPDLRIEKIVLELKKLEGKNLLEMYNEMLPILEHNHNHFFGKFKEIITDEAIINFQKCIHLYNKDLSERFQIQDLTPYKDVRVRILD